ncbi:hypothetical protein BKA93DRAFT_749114 [Sparassis latifolia]
MATRWQIAECHNGVPGLSSKTCCVSLGARGPLTPAKVLRGLETPLRGAWVLYARCTGRDLLAMWPREPLRPICVSAAFEPPAVERSEIPQQHPGATPRAVTCGRPVDQSTGSRVCQGHLEAGTDEMACVLRALWFFEFDRMGSKIISGTLAAEIKRPYARELGETNRVLGRSKEMLRGGAGSGIQVGCHKELFVTAGLVNPSRFGKYSHLAATVEEMLREALAGDEAWCTA